mmetsp:Transcript_17204/g.39751  ORF Transcript_17204/g.39751 Transcript_17204/m.39751 type:complete len:1215 (-) Transcript_17204:108-3752(-)|eukprot:CAMPEP_0197174776 /NCGR_PEP_ID=MMETSP1423-20130617/1153_1 /TAXON_ID=476441 /ORGANISM="Pseudo-nitzschia heimii, Strain UNC1101" /LENGTH=1214 /DNA_ID=CAMNT_0042623755 /DNA_START=161 /DNA_END=3805 /DNA_ORIENTATION=+
MTSYQHDTSGGLYEPIESNATPSERKSKKWLITGAIVVILGTILAGGHHNNAGKSTADAIKKSDLLLNDDGSVMLVDEKKRFVLEDYDAKATFASFLPAIAGFFGKPSWTFYVNRGQGVSSFGIESKDYPLLEFNAANKAYQSTPLLGFRTFVRGTIKTAMKGTSFMTEPFSSTNTRNIDDPNDDPNKPKRLMYAGMNEFQIKEIDGVNGLTTTVQYTTLPEENFAAMLRRTTFKNTGNSEVELEILDGLAQMEPSGGALEGMLKSMSRTLEGWFLVDHVDDTLNMPFYHMSTEPGDGAKVKIEEKGNYCLAFIESSDGDSELLPIVFDKGKVFGKVTSLEFPFGLQASSVGEILDGPQYGYATTSSAFAAVRSLTLKPGEEVTIASVYGRADHIEEVPKIADILTKSGYSASKFDRAREILNELTIGVETNTSNPLFDITVRQMFLDNSLRGGLATIIGNVEGDENYDEDPSVKVFHTFSRIHGDLERDYNFFKITPSYYSSGPGNYRDIIQNRRNDVTFLPRMGSFDVKYFLSFIQADGYEPLTVEAPVYMYDDEAEADRVARLVTKDQNSANLMGGVLKGGTFRPGQLFDIADEIGVNRIDDDSLFMHTIIKSAIDRPMATFGEGYWGDHWDYYIDLVEAYLGIFPDGEESLMYDCELNYFFSTATIKPRSDKYVADYTYDGQSQHILQLDATFFDQGKSDEQDQFRIGKTGLLGINASWQRTEDGRGFTSTPIAKLLLLGAIKFATRDAWGMGVEYEGGRPGWMDSMNGLPGMVGSGMAETYELSLLLKYVTKVVEKYDRDVVVPVELGIMIATVEEALDELQSTSYKDSFPLPEDVPEPLFQYWDKVATAREEYRAKVTYYFSGETVSYTGSEVSEMLKRWIEEIDLGVERAHNFGTKGFGDDGTSGIPAAYFSYDVTEWEENGKQNDQGLALVDAKAMRVGVFPLFLEGPIRYMKTVIDDKTKLTDMYERILTSGLRDDGIKMYKVSACLKGQSYDMGRQMAFAPGWLENESVWVHMGYKYYLQLLRGKLYDQFFSEYRGGILPFMDKDVYGRPLTEASSFIASSAFPDPDIPGQGFVARLSGSTAEFLDIYQLMFYGPNMFYLNDESEVEFKLTPTLPSWFFRDEDGTGVTRKDAHGQYILSFKLFGKMIVTYHNPKGETVYEASPKKYTVTMTDGVVHTVDGKFIPNELALKIRRTTGVASIDAYL